MLKPIVDEKNAAYLTIKDKVNELLGKIYQASHQEYLTNFYNYRDFYPGRVVWNSNLRE
jgi:hypothetical protein